MSSVLDYIVSIIVQICVYKSAKSKEFRKYLDTLSSICLPKCNCCLLLETRNTIKVLLF